MTSPISFDFDGLVRRAEAWLERARHASYEDFWQGWEPTPFREEGVGLLDELSKAIREIENYVVEHGEKKSPYKFTERGVETVDIQEYMQRHPDTIVVDVSRYVPGAPEEPYDVASVLYVIRDAELAEKYRKLRELADEIDDILNLYRFVE
jgi:hypothetical protein